MGKTSLKLTLPTTVLQPVSSVITIDNLVIYVADVTPAIAAKILAYAAQLEGQNRRIKPGVVKRYVHAMNNGAWQFTHQGIAFDTEKRLTDGQHRLTAIVQTNKPARFIVTEGWPSEVLSSIDMGDNRDLAGSLRILGMTEHLGGTDAADVVAVTLNGIQRYAKRDNAKVSVADAAKLIDRYDAGLRWIVSRGLSARGRGAMTGCVLAALAYAYPCAAKIIDRAWEDMESGAGLRKGDPMIALRKMFDNRKYLKNDLGRVVVFERVLAVLYLRLHGEKRQILKRSADARAFFDAAYDKHE